MILKCKMCGGELKYTDGATVCECEFCGTRQTLPKLDDDHRANLYDRANHFRRNNDYDKAMGIYEKILEEDGTDAEAYWSIVLCRYGIEYVEDPGTHKRVPTVNRAQYTSILADDDYKSALQYADAAQQEIYRSEAEYIDRVQKGILEISQKEKPFDVFLCYKETDEQGRRTRDSVTANEIYHELTREGLKVFFARITLEDKIGEAYEPYIFAALNSAKVMVVLGSKAEYFNAVWVRNEWSRFLGLIRAGQRKTLIPAYKDMDPYDLPEEFSHLQALDMNKLGFMPDLIRGIKKIVGAEQKQEVPKAAPQVVQTVGVAAGNAAPLLRRAFLALEDGDFARADDFCEQALNLDPENAEAYLGKMLAEMKVRRLDDLKNQAMPFEKNANYQKVLRFGNDEEKAQVQGYVRFIQDRNENNRKQGILDDTLKVIRSATSADAFDRARAQLETIKGFEGVKEALAECDAKKESLLCERYDSAEKMLQVGQPVQAKMAFEALGDYRDSREKVEVCAEAIRDQDYRKALNKQSERKWDEAIIVFKALGDYRDSKEKVKDCQEAQETEIREAAERERQEKLLAERQAREAAARRNRNVLITMLVVALGVASFFIMTKVVIPNGHYDKGVSLRAEQKWMEAVAEFTEAGEYQDAATQIQATYYTWGEKLREAKDWNAAVAAFEEAGTYNDATIQVLATRYEEGVSKLAADDWDGAAKAFQQAGIYEDATDRVKATRLAEGEAKRAAGDWDGAVDAYVLAGKTIEAQATRYEEGEAKRSASDWDGAIKAFKQAGTYEDASTQIIETQYQQASSLTKAGKYEEAYEVFSKILGYKNVDSLIKNDESFADVAAIAAAREAQLKPYKTVGSTVTFGSYEQDNNKGNGKEPVEWIVLDTDGTKSLLISKYALDAKPYNEEYTSITWEKSTLRTWLNRTFRNIAFSSTEQKVILTTNVDNSDAQGCSGYSASGGNNTQDKLFLLSYAEAWKYFKTDNDRTCTATEYAKRQGEDKTNNGNCWWWLRSPGSVQRVAAFVDRDGACHFSFVSDSSSTIRPAFWLNLESQFFKVLLNNM